MAPGLRESNEQDRVGWIRHALDEYQGRLIRYAYRFIGDIHQAKDAVQDTYLKLCDQHPDSIENLGSWLFRVCRNRAIDVAKKENRSVVSDIQDIDRRPTPLPTPSDVVERLEDLESLRVAFAGLTPIQQEVLHLKFQEGLTHSRIAEVTGLTPSKVNHLVYGGVDELRRRVSRRPMKRSSLP